MAALSELMAQKADLERQIAEVQRRERTEALAKIRGLMMDYGLTVDDVLGRGSRQAAGGERSKVAPKYRNPVTGETWSGRGLKPKWLQAALAEGKQLGDFAV